MQVQFANGSKVEVNDGDIVQFAQPVVVAGGRGETEFKAVITGRKLGFVTGRRLYTVKDWRVRGFTVKADPVEAHSKKVRAAFDAFLAKPDATRYNALQEAALLVVARATVGSK